jgi:hypothetical protein
MAKYTGNALYLAFHGVALNTDFRSFSDTETIDTVDASAGADTVKTYLTTLKDGTASGEFVDQTGGSAIWTALTPGTAGTLEWGPEGTASGKQRHYVNAICTNRKRDTPYSDIVVISAEFQFSGAVTDTAYA